MCGIVGAFSFGQTSFEVTESYLTRMRDTMAHRGPDGGANWVSPDRRVGLGHRRLSIIDLTTVANQPMCNEDGTLWVAFNGEIYNHQDIRAELQRKGGHTWKTNHSDTEVILHAFEEWGIDCLHRFRGMFAIALWDVKRQSLWLIRDRLGVKPLYYSHHHGRITFASEIKALLADPEQSRRINEDSLQDYFSFVTTPAPETMYAGIRKLPPGGWMRVDRNGRTVEHCYWDVWDHVQPLPNISEEEAAERLLAELKVAVQLRKVSDVPVGVFLSGGVDSSTNAALFSAGDQQELKTFTVGYQGDHPGYENETDAARQMAEFVGADHHDRFLTVDELISFLPTMVRLQDEPVADPVCFPLYHLSKLARDNGVIVCQVGEGADELFCGYSTWKHRLQLAGHLDRLQFPGIRPALLAGLRFCGKGDSIVAEGVRRSLRGVPSFWNSCDFFTEGEKSRLWSPRLRQKLQGRSSWDSLAPLYARYQQNAWEQTHLNWMTYADLQVRMAELLLMRVDKMSMGVSLEARVPFLDHKVVELAFSLPSAIRFQGGTLKPLLKRAVRGLIPDAVIDRPKQGFSIPVHDWVMGRMEPIVRSTMREFCAETDLLDPRMVDEILSARDGYRCWFLMNLALWWREYIAQQPVGLEQPVRRAA